MNERGDTEGAGPEPGEQRDLAERTRVQAQEARAEVLRAFQRLREQGVVWAEDPESHPGGPDPKQD